MISIGLFTIFSLICGNKDLTQISPELCELNTNICYEWYKERPEEFKLKEIEIIKICTKEVTGLDLIK